MILSPEQQEEIFQAPHLEPTEIEGIGTIALLDISYLEFTRWGWIDSVTFIDLDEPPPGTAQQFIIENGSGDSEIEVEETETYPVKRVETIGVTYVKDES